MLLSVVHYVNKDTKVEHTNRTESSRGSRWHPTGKGGADGSLHRCITPIELKVQGGADGTQEEEEVDAARVVRADAQLVTTMVHR